ncbi:MAG: hypothetical protein GY756_05205 [bacterium]|nr:hypothetical protein [bacterium]
MYIIIIILLIKQGFSQNIDIPLRFDKYYTYEEVVKAIKALNKAYPKITKSVLVGHSDENREIWALEINNPATGRAVDKPGVYVDANIHGNEIQAGEVALYFADYLLKNYNKLDKVTKLVNKNSYYIIPVVNVDGRYHFMKEGNTTNSNRSLRLPKDDDRDGLFDEDNFDDLDGDGNICQMRKKDPNGKYKSDSDDPRLLVKVKENEKGEWSLLGQEGIDNDGDGKVNEDKEGYVDPNRNWGFDWQPNYVQNGAGYYPFSGTGIKSIANYIQNRPNIIIVFAFHNTGGMFLRGPGNKHQGPLNSSDIKVYDILGKNAEKIVPGYRYLISWKDLYSTYGDFTDFTYNVFGAYSFVGELFMKSQETYTTESKLKPKEESFFSDDRIETKRQRLKFNDNLAHGSLFKEWEKYKHPTYGDIEIGGWTKLSTRISHTFMLPDLAHRNASAIIFSASQTPEISLEVFKKEKITGNMYRINIRLKNHYAIPTMSYHAIHEKIYPQDILKVSGTGIKVLAGGKLTNKYTDRAEYKEFRPETQFLSIPGYGIVEYTFLVEGSGNVSISYKSRKAKNIQKQIKLK